MNELKSGVYRHYKGDYYQVLFVADLVFTPVQKDDTLGVFVCGEDIRVVEQIWANRDRRRNLNWTRWLFCARAHDRMSAGTEVAVYVPLYANKPGRRISVRPVKDFFEDVTYDKPDWPDGVVSVTEKRFTYVGDEVPQ